VPDILRRLRWRTVALLLPVFAAFPPAPAAAGKPVVSNARLYVSHSNIVTDLTCRDLFSEQVTGTVESGLPAVVELLYRLVDRKDEQSHRGIHTYQLQYDVWEDVYTLDAGDSASTFSSFASMQRAVEHLTGVAIVPLDDVEPGGVYAVELSISVQPLRGGEEQKIVGWVNETVRGTSDDSWHEQLLNVNDLIHRFFSRNRDSSDRSDWFRGIWFTPASLPFVRQLSPAAAAADSTGGDRR
jgi:hypothetical protein